MGAVYEFEPKPAEPKVSKKIEGAQEDTRPLIDRLDSISKEMFEKGPEAAYDDFYGRKRKSKKTKYDKREKRPEEKSDDEIVEELSNKRNREIIATDSELFKAYKERIIGKEGK